jgi:hypothetical protein
MQRFIPLDQYIFLEFSQNEPPKSYLGTETSLRQLYQLCAANPDDIPGLTVVQDFISEEEEKLIANEIDRCPWDVRALHIVFRCKTLFYASFLQNQVFFGRNTKHFKDPKSIFKSARNAPSRSFHFLAETFGGNKRR